MTPREFEKATGQVMSDEVKVIHFSPDRTLGEPLLHNNGRLVINGVELLGIMHRDMFGEHEGGNWDPDTAEVGFGTPQNIH